MNLIKKRNLQVLEEFYLKLNEIYSSLGITYQYLEMLHIKKENNEFNYLPEIFSILNQLNDFLNKHIFVLDFEDNILTAIRIKTFLYSIGQLMEFWEKLSNGNPDGFNEAHKITSLERMLINWEAKFLLIEAQKFWIEKNVNLCLK